MGLCHAPSLLRSVGEFITQRFWKAIGKNLMTKLTVDNADQLGLRGKRVSRVSVIGIRPPT